MKKYGNYKVMSEYCTMPLQRTYQYARICKNVAQMKEPSANASVISQTPLGTAGSSQTGIVQMSTDNEAAQLTKNSKAVCSAHAVIGRLQNCDLGNHQQGDDPLVKIESLEAA